MSRATEIIQLLRTRETCIIKRTDSSEDLFHARTEAANPRGAIFLNTRQFNDVLRDRYGCTHS